MIKLISRILHLNGPESTNYIIIIAEPKSGEDMVIAIQDNKGHAIEVQKSVIDYINETITELQLEIEMKSKESANPNRIQIVES